MMGLRDSGPRPESLIATEDLSRIFGSGETAVTAVNAVNLEVPQGELMAVVGRSGSGKTTLLNLLSGLDRPTNGKVIFQGRDLTTFSESDLVELRRHKIGFVFQSFGLMPLLSAQENVELPLHISGVSWRERRRRAMASLDLVGLGSRARHRPYELSGGEQQRVSIARALVTGPEAIFADEPTGELDTTTALSIGSILKDVVKESKATIIIATHDLTLAGICDSVIQIADGALGESPDLRPSESR
ncbi:MAG: ABC transporter ATP-binding protein [Dehalococcoidia bacterium]|nr:ABC transporter ATP-binding protein [Dehalococcoidia bacterium]HIB10639.1 ABC transporter ATP-binding protein [Dehalococcoidia bacterium]